LDVLAVEKTNVGQMHWKSLAEIDSLAQVPVNLWVDGAIAQCRKEATPVTEYSQWLLGAVVLHAAMTTVQIELRHRFTSKQLFVQTKTPAGI
jgi:hypothetical protein